MAVFTTLELAVDFYQLTQSLDLKGHMKDQLECQTVFKLLNIDDPVITETADKLGAHLYKLVNSEIKPSPWR